MLTDVVACVRLRGSGGAVAVKVITLEVSKKLSAAQDTAHSPT